MTGPETTTFAALLTENPYVEAYAEPGAHTIIDPIHPATGRGLYSDETLEQVRVRYPRAERVEIAAWQAHRAAEQDAPITWHPTTAEAYAQALECLPPIDDTGRGFLVGEPTDHHAQSGRPRFEAYRQIGTHSYEVSNRPMTRQEWRGTEEKIR